MPTWAIQHKKTKKWLLRFMPNRHPELYGDLCNTDEEIYTSPFWDVVVSKANECTAPVEIIKIHNLYPQDYQERISKYGGRE